MSKQETAQVVEAVEAVNPIEIEAQRLAQVAYEMPTKRGGKWPEKRVMLTTYDPAIGYQGGMLPLILAAKDCRGDDAPELPTDKGEALKTLCGEVQDVLETAGGEGRLRYLAPRDHKGKPISLYAAWKVHLTRSWVKGEKITQAVLADHRHKGRLDGSGGKAQVSGIAAVEALL